MVLNHRPFKPVFTGLNRFKRSMCLGVKTGKNPNKKNEKNHPERVKSLAKLMHNALGKSLGGPASIALEFELLFLPVLTSLCAEPTCHTLAFFQHFNHALPRQYAKSVH